MGKCLGLLVAVTTLTSPQLVVLSGHISHKSSAALDFSEQNLM
jgi:hypothetical protein